MTTAPPKDTTMPAFGEVNYLDINIPVDGWVAKERARRAANQIQPSAPDLSDESINNTIEKMELAQNYPDLTAEEWAAIHNPADRKKYALTVAEYNQLRDTTVKWVKSGGESHIEKYDTGITAGIYSRGNLTVYEITRPDGSSHHWMSDTSVSRLKHRITPQGELIRRNSAGDEISILKTQNVVFTDCSRSQRTPGTTMPISDWVNNGKGRIVAGFLADGTIRISAIRGVVKPYQFVVKSPEGAFITVDKTGTPMLAQLNKLSKEIPVDKQDIARHNAFAMQVERGERSLDEIARQATPQELANRAGTTDLSESSIRHTRQRYKEITRLERNGLLATATEEDLNLQSMPPSHAKRIEQSKQQTIISR